MSEPKLLSKEELEDHINELAVDAPHIVAEIHGHIAALESLGARGGTMMAEKFRSALDLVDPLLALRLQEHHTAQGARIAAMEQHISELEKSLDNARKEREQTLADWREYKTAKDADVAEWQRRAESLIKQAEDLESELARLKPSGHVAEDVAAVEADLTFEPTHQREIDARAALSRLAAKAHGYEAAIQRAEAAEGLLDNAYATATTAQKREEAAVADNAALLDWIDQNGHARWCERAQGREFRCTDGCAAKPVTSAPHPGAALLEQHRKALVRARNEGLERAAKCADKAERGCFAAKGAVEDATRKAMWQRAADCAADVAENIRAMKEPEQ